MTRSSHQRIARRAAPPAFAMPPEGMLSQQVDLSAYGLTLGLIHPEGAPLMVAAWNGEGLRRLLPEQATQWADELVAAGQAVALAPVIEAVRALVRKVGDIAAASIMRDLATVPAEGCA